MARTVGIGIEIAEWENRLYMIKQYSDKWWERSDVH